MTIWDDRILEYIEEEGSASPKQLEESGYFDVTKGHLSRRLRKLADKGFLKDLGNGVYIMSSRGEAYLNEELDASELDENGSNDEAAEA
ncbi:winged helix-turn-helix domain-containing protein [Halolamina litorea]|uniref:ArsR family transcriptional regulator n=1 Tax=Halolamina litorea TaxID=1515593 RepID=A0ABD6BMB6_9EURY|nr:PhiH1 repressor [Halolamina litorea]